jgi:hypothetical protein
MFKKINNKTLLIIFGVLALVAVAVYFYDSKKGERTFRSDLFKIDSAGVTAITIYKKGSAADFIKLVKTGKGWEIRDQKKEYPADTNIVKNLLSMLSHISAQRVAGSDRESWKAFEITDSASTRVIVEQGKEVTADFRLGKSSFSQNRNRQNYGGGYGMEVSSHIRVPDDDRVYVVDGYLSMMFTGDASRYRNHLVMKFDKKDVMRFSLVYPGDSSFNLVREGNKWLVNNQPADSTLTEQWLNSVSQVTNGEFGENDNLPFNMPYSLHIEGNNMQPIDLKGFKDETARKFVITTSANLSAVFSSMTPGLFRQVFPSKSRFFPSAKIEKKKTKK